MAFVSDFLEFLKKYQVVGLAIAFIIGAASTKLVTALVNDIIMPLAGLLLPAGEWKAATLNIGGASLLIGNFIGALIDFLIIAGVVFFMVKWVMREDPKQKR